MAFGCTPPGGSNQPRQLSVTFPVHDQQNQPIAILQNEFTANDEVQAQLTGGGMCPDNSGNTALVGQGECAVPKFKSPLDQFTRMRGTS